MRRAAWLAAAVALWAAPSFAGDEGPTPLKLWHAYRGGEEEALEKSAALFTQQTGTKVELLAIPYDALAQKLTSAIPHGVGPDVFIFAHERLRSFQRMDIVAASDGSIDKAAYFGNSVDALGVEGKTYGYPLALKCLALYVNRDLVPLPPSNTAELLRLLPTLSRKGENRFGLAYESGDFYLHAPFLFGFGGQLFDAQGTASFDTQGMARSLAFVKGLQDAQFMPGEASGALVKSLFNDGRAAMVVSGPWFAGEISPSVKYAVVQLPANSETGLPMRPFLGVEAAFASSRSEQPQKAQELARFLSVGGASGLRATIGRQVPANLAAYEDPAVRADNLISSFREAAAQATPMPNTMEMSRVWEPMKLALRAVLQGGVAPKDAGALADRRYRALYRPRPPDASPLPYLLVLGLAAVGYVVWKAR
ncbi:MAG: extracellular solute-binding protein, partial [Myxococcaceae bacterium]